MNILSRTYQEAARTENICLPFLQQESLARGAFFSLLSPEIQRTVETFIKKEMKGEEGEIKTLWLKEGKPLRIILSGLGERSKWHERKRPLFVRRMIQYAKKERLSEITIPATESLGTEPKSRAALIASDALMAHFEYTAYRETPKDGWPEIKTLYLAGDETQRQETEQGIEEGMIVGEEVNACRALANTPGSDMTPMKLAAEAKKIAQKHGIKIKVLDEDEMKRIGMGGVLGVAKGSDEKPRFIIMEYQRGPAGQPPLALAGKGVTFDTGGLNLKSDQAIYEMHMDMSGGAAAIHGIAAIARMKLPVNIVGLIPAVENMPSGSSYRPGDLLKSLSGKTIEVLNTDAEGRIILADAFTYALRYKPGLLVSLATLTGAAHVALGHHCSALFTNREGLLQPLIEIGKISGDYVWPLPLWDEYLAEIKGTFGDIANAAKGDRYGGAIYGAKFLEQFALGIPFAHVDIAPRMTSIDSEYLAKGATGVGVRYIVELAKRYPDIETQISKSK